MTYVGFRECHACWVKPGSPTLCASCLHNRTRIAELEAEVANWQRTAVELTRDLDRHIAAETEACAKVAEDYSRGVDGATVHTAFGRGHVEGETTAAQAIAAAIRARGASTNSHSTGSKLGGGAACSKCDGPHFRVEQIGSGHTVQRLHHAEFRLDDGWWSIGSFDQVNKCTTFGRDEAEAMAAALNEAWRESRG